MHEKLMNEGRLREEMAKAGLDAVVASSPNTVFYTSGALVVSQRKTSPNLASRLVEDRFAFTVLPLGEEPTLILSEEEAGTAMEEAWARDIQSYAPQRDSPVEILASVLQRRGLASGRLGLEERYLTIDQEEDLAHLLPKVHFAQCDDMFDLVRAVKTEKEILLLKRAANATEEAIMGAFRTGQVGETEKQMADRMCANVLRLGADSPYGVILGFGENVCHDHSRPGARLLATGDLIHVDFGGKWGGYAADISRMAVVGFPSRKRRDAYRKLWSCHRRSIAAIRAGMRACDVFQRAKLEFETAGVEFKRVHVGHSFSLGGHDNPMLQPFEQMVIEPNMVLCIEPSLFDGGFDRYHIEDMIRVTEDGEPELLSDYSNTEELFAVV